MRSDGKGGITSKNWRLEKLNQLVSNRKYVIRGHTIFGAGDMPVHKLVPIGRAKKSLLHYDTMT
jgi:hypothetical protein